jgi:hypothetical protein
LRALESLASGQARVDTQPPLRGGNGRDNSPLSADSGRREERYVKNIQVFDGADNAVYDIFAATDEEFALIFRDGTDVAFIDEVYQNQPSQTLNAAFTSIWNRRVPKREAMGIHGILFYECEHKKVYYPTRRDEEALNPNGSRLR